MRQSSGGMQTQGLHYSIYCPKCGKPAARMEECIISRRYLHFTDKGSVWHDVPNDGADVHGENNCEGEETT